MGNQNFKKTNICKMDSLSKIISEPLFCSEFVKDVSDSRRYFKDEELLDICNGDFLYCFKVSSLAELKRLENYVSIHPSPEDYRRCVAREKYLEIKSSISQGKAIFYNDKTKNFYDVEFNEVKIDGKKIFPRIDVNSINEILSQIENKGGISIVSLVEVEKTMNWLNFYSPKRKIKQTTFGELLEKGVDFYRSENGAFFIKTLFKHMHEVGENISNMDIVYSLHPDSKVIISEAVDIMKDSFGTKEYRIYVVEGKLISASRMLDYERHNVPDEIITFAKEIINLIPKEFPSSYVVDLMEYSINGVKDIDVVEFNTIIASGRYVLNSI